MTIQHPNYLTITFEGSGSLTIDMREFFPCSKEKMKKLLRILADDFENREELYDRLAVYFYEKMLICKEKIEFAEALPDIDLYRKQTKEMKRWQSLMDMLPVEHRKEVNKNE